MYNDEHRPFSFYTATTDKDTFKDIHFLRFNSPDSPAFYPLVWNLYFTTCRQSRGSLGSSLCQNLGLQCWRGLARWLANLGRRRRPLALSWQGLFIFPLLLRCSVKHVRDETPGSIIVTPLCSDDMCRHTAFRGTWKVSPAVSFTRWTQRGLIGDRLQESLESFVISFAKTLLLWCITYFHQN